MLLAIVGLCAVCIQVRYKREFAARQEETNEELYNEQAALECHLSTEVTATALQACCGDDLTWGQMLSFAWSVVRSFGNLGLLMYTGMQLEPLRKGPWDLEKHIVVFGEAFAAFWILAGLAILMVSCIIPAFRTEERAESLALSKRLISVGANFSCLRLLPAARPEAAWQWVGRIASLKISLQVQSMAPPRVAAAYHISLHAFVIVATILFATLAVMSVSVKVSQLAFITEGIRWTPTHYLTFALLINSLAGLRGDMEQQRLVSVLTLLDENPTDFQQKLASQVLELHKNTLKACIVFNTMTSKQCIDLLKKEKV